MSRDSPLSTRSLSCRAKSRASRIEKRTTGETGFSRLITFSAAPTAMSSSAAESNGMLRWLFGSIREPISSRFMTRSNWSPTSDRMANDGGLALLGAAVWADTVALKASATATAHRIRRLRIDVIERLPSSRSRRRRRQVLGERVAAAAQGPDRLQPRRDRLHLGAQRLDVGIDGAVHAVAVVAPDAVEQRLAREDVARARRERLQQPELVARELERAAVVAHLHAALVDGDRPARDRGR